MYRKLLHRILCCVLLASGICVLSAGCGKEGAVKEESVKDVPEESVRENEQCVEEIKKRGFLTVGCKMDVPDLGFYDAQTDSWSGLETELAYQTAAKIFAVSVEEAKEQGLVRFVGVTVADREDKLENGEVDCLFATYTITAEREERFAFSHSYYTDYIGMMVKSSGDNPNSLGSSEIRSIADLDGKYIGVPKNATTRRTFLNYIETMNSVKTAPIFMEYESYEALFRALKKGDIDVMAVDVSILNGYVDSSTKILDDRFGGQRYGAAVRKENVPLLKLINEALETADSEA